MNVRGWLRAALLCVLSISGLRGVEAGPACSGDALISEQFDNGARWELCWESRTRENLVISDVFYTPPGGVEQRVLGDARLSQLHVAYDDNDVTYHDVTQYGLGAGYLVAMTEADCPGGTLLTVHERPALCRWREHGADAWRSLNASSRADSLNLFSTSQVGAYVYMITWKFFADGAISPIIGASGALQRSTDDLDSPFGRRLAGDDTALWLSHTHNYYWRLDFDIGASATDDTVTEDRLEMRADGSRIAVTDTFDTEQARVAQPAALQAWTIWDTNPASDSIIGASADRLPAGWRIEPSHLGHRLVRTGVEPYTGYDFFVTVQNDCERFASQNARFNPDCLNNVLQYVDGESLQDQDIVAWQRVSFHHVPRNEDQRNMHTHWDGFTIEPVNVHARTPGFEPATNAAPVILPIAAMTHRVGERVWQRIAAVDEENDRLGFVASGLPDGVTLLADGTLEGEPSTAGDYAVEITVYDDQSDSRTAFAWHVTAAGSARGSADGSGGRLSAALLLALGSATLLRALASGLAGGLVAGPRKRSKVVASHTRAGAAGVRYAIRADGSSPPTSSGHGAVS